MREIRTFFADFRRFLLIFAFPGNYSILGAQIFAGNRRISQQTADFCRNPFVPFSLSLLVPPYAMPMTTCQCHHFWQRCCLTEETSAANQSLFLGRGCDEALFSDKKKRFFFFFTERGEAIQ